MDRTADVVIVGGGIRGLSIAYYLARAGLRVSVVERGQIGAGASSANAGLVNASQKRPAHYTAFSLLSGDMYPEFVAGLEAPVDYQRDGFLRVAETDAEAESLARDAAAQ